MNYYVVDAFTNHPFGGNPAGVVLLDNKLISHNSKCCRIENNDLFPNDNLMLNIAAELRYSETAFVRQLSPSQFHVRYFTPVAEVELCGHATIATFSLLRQIGLAAGHYKCRTLAGNLDIDVEERVFMQMATPRIVSTVSDTALIYKALGIEDYCPSLPVQIAYAGLSDLMIQVSDVDVLNNLQPNMDAISDVTQKLDAVSFHVFALADDEYTAHVRDFAPLYGVPEESATGTANAALAHYLLKHGVVDNPCECSFLQGTAMGRPSVVVARIAADGNIYIGGSASVVAEGCLLPNIRSRI